VVRDGQRSNNEEEKERWRSENQVRETMWRSSLKTGPRGEPGGRSVREERGGTKRDGKELSVGRFSSRCD